MVNFKLLEKLYTDINEPSSFTSVEPLYAAAKAIDKNITKKNVKNFLKQQPTYTLHRRTLKKIKRLPTTAPGLHSRWQADLAVLINLSRYNNNYAYILVCIDVLSRQIFVAPLKTKKSEDVINGFKKIFKKSKFIPWNLCTDAGLEFTATKVQEFFKQKEISHYTLHTSIEFHAGMVERANRTIKERLFRYFTHNCTKNWVKVIDDIVNSINNSYNRSIGTFPNSINFKNAETLRLNLLNKKEIIKKPEIFKVGQKVRVGKFKHAFEKGYLPNYSDQIYTISKVRMSQPVTYKITNDRGKEQKGWCYFSELSPVTINQKTTYRIDNVLKTKTVNGVKFYYVQWTGYDDSYNNWVSEHNLV